MTTIARATILAVLAVVATSSPATSEPAQPYAPGLVEYMLTAQSHHAKLWLAGNARNWNLADYQLDELKELLEDVAKRIPRYRDVPVGQMIEAATLPSLEEVEAAIKMRNGRAFATAFDKLTAACNACHEAANRGFIVIRRPAMSPFPNQSFSPRK
jgi:cytochrome c553